MIKCILESEKEFLSPSIYLSLYIPYPYTFISIPLYLYTSLSLSLSLSLSISISIRLLRLFNKHSILKQKKSLMLNQIKYNGFKYLIAYYYSQPTPIIAFLIFYISIHQMFCVYHHYTLSIICASIHQKFNL